MKRSIPTRLIAYTALMTALCYVGSLLGFSGGQFYFNLGDSVILITASLLGPLPAMLAGGIGSLLADLTVYPATMLYTLFIKAIEGLVAGLLFYLIRKCFDAVRRKAEQKYSLKADAQTADAAPIATPPAQLDDAVCAPDSAARPDPQIIDGERPNDDQTVDADEAQPVAANAENGASHTQNSDINPKLTKKLREIKIAEALTFTVAALFSTALMMVGYFVCQTFFYGTLAAALVALPMDAVQASVSTAVATLALYAFGLDKLRTSLRLKK